MAQLVGESKQHFEEEEPEVELDEEEPKKKLRRAASGWLRDRRVGELMRDKRRLVEVPYTATLLCTVNALVANGIVAVPVAAPPGKWIGAGGSMILESDPATGAVRKHYIGMVTMLDILVHIAEDDGEAHDGDKVVDLEKKMSVAVSSIIGHSLEGLSLWTLNPNTSILDCMEVFSKGVHRALVPVESQADNVIAVELTEASPGYKMLTQMDVLRFVKDHGDELKDIISCSVGKLGAISENVVAVTKDAMVIDAIKAMRSCSLTAVPIVEALDVPIAGPILQNGTGTRLVGTFSASDLRLCSIEVLQSWLSANVMDFNESMKTTNIAEGKPGPRELVTCNPSSSLAEVIDKAVKWHVHRVWVVDQQVLLEGVISLTDIMRVIREAALQADTELSIIV